MTSFNGRRGVVVPQSGDYNATQIPVSGEPEAETVATALSNKAPGGFGFGDAIQEIVTTSAEESYETYCAKVAAGRLSAEEATQIRADLQAPASAAK